VAVDRLESRGGAAIPLDQFLAHLEREVGFGIEEQGRMKSAPTARRADSAALAGGIGDVDRCALEAQEISAERSRTAGRDVTRESTQRGDPSRDQKGYERLAAPRDRPDPVVSRGGRSGERRGERCCDGRYGRRREVHRGRRVERQPGCERNAQGAG
jgi:hypothetical protein